MQLPDVRINALALRNLHSLPFKQLRASSGDAPPTLSARARWLEHGLGPEQALTAAATAALAESVPSALVAPVRSTLASQKDGSPPAIWIFGSHADIAQATELLGDAFTVVQDGVWTPCGPRAQTDALFDAISRAIMAALETDGAIRVGSDIVDTAAKLSYRFNLVLASSATPTIILRVTVHQCELRQVDDEDTIAVLQEEQAGRPFPVIVSPLALHATLSKRRIAGDALSASVLARWQEAGLLPSGTLKDSAVVFLSLGSGLDVPFPRACVLTSVKKDRMRLEKASISSTHSRGVSLNPRRDREVLWRSRKRPRSPSAVVEEREEQRIATSIPPHVKPVMKSQPAAKVGSRSNPVFDAAAKISVLNASVFNNALVRAGAKDPTPVLNHPLARTPGPSPPLEQSSGTKTSSGNYTDKPSTQHVGSTAKSTSLGMESTGRGYGKSGNQSSDLDTIFGTGNMDMADVGSLDDELEFDDLFGGGMDSVIGSGNSEPSFSVLDSSSNRGVSNTLEGSTNQTRNKKSTQKQASASNQKNALGSRLAASPVRTSVPGLGVRSNGIEKQRSPKSNMSSTEVLQKVLSSLVSLPSPTKSPDDSDREAQLKSFYEEDFTKRVTDSLRSKPAVSHRAASNVVCPSDSRYVPNYTKYGSLEAIRRLLNSKQDTKPNLKVRQKYVPKRRLAMYNSLARKNSTYSEIKREVSKYSAQLDGSSDSESDTDNEEYPMQRTTSMGNANTETTKEQITTLLKDETDSPETKDSVESINTADALKVAQNVAVDCASACMVLIDEYQRSATNLHAGSSRNQLLSGTAHSGSNACATTGNGTPSHCLDEKVVSQIGSAAQPNPIPASPVPSKLHPPGNSFNRSYPAPAVGAGTQKCSHKKEKDANALLALLQMHCITVKGLQLFTNLDEGASGLQLTSDSLCDKSSRSTPVLSYKSMEPNPVSSAVLRRVLHGFSRTVECSKALRNYAVNAGSDNCSGKLQVSGPLKLSDVYGDGSEIVCLTAPRVCVGFNNEWIETSGGVLPLWEKSGLEPYSEKKHVMYTILAPKSSEEDARVFFRDVSAAYEECSFGKHTPLPGDVINCVAISQPAAKPLKLADGNELSAEDSAMIQQFGLAVTSLSNKLTSMRRSEDTASNVVVYVVSPFRRGANAANSALLRTIAPLLHSIPGIVASTVSNTSHSTQPSPPNAWRSQSAVGNGLSLHVRVVPYDAIDRRISCWMKPDSGIGIAPRPQLVKGLAFSVYSSLRSKRLGNHGVGFDKESTSGITVSPDSQMSPMTPDLVATTPHSDGGSPNGPGIEEGVACSQHNVQNQHSTVAIDQSSALWPSFLHEPAVVLAGVGRQQGQAQPGQQGDSDTTSMVLHLAYAFCKEQSRFVFAWTDSRGEMLDLASVPVLGNGANGTRRQAFWCMWLRGQRWKVPYVESLHVTICKLGEMEDGEVEDWDRVTCRILYGSVSVTAEAEERAGIVRRFNDVDVYMDHPTPATPATSQHHGTPVNQLRNDIIDTQPHGIKSVTLCAVQQGAGDRLLINDAHSGADGVTTDFICSADTPLYGEKHVLGKALLASADEDGVDVLEVDVVLHYGAAQNDKSHGGWNANTASEIARAVASNFHELRLVGSPPCWPMERWRNALPIHLEMVSNFQLQIRAALTPSSR